MGQLKCTTLALSTNNTPVEHFAALCRQALSDSRFDTIYFVSPQSVFKQILVHANKCPILLPLKSGGKVTLT